MGLINGKNLRLEMVQGIDGTKCINKVVQEVPAGVKYLSDWNEFNFANYFYRNGNENDQLERRCVIINKQIPGCGMTEYCLNGPEFVILCSPRKLLLQNKYDQHFGDVYLVVNEMDSDIDVDKDISKENKARAASVIKEKVLTEQEILSLEEKRKLIYKRIYTELEAYISDRRMKGKAPKILVTYDSYHIIVDILKSLSYRQDWFNGIFGKFYTVVDEFQSILHDARFKSTTELNFTTILKSVDRVIFASATPMLDKYLVEIPLFNNVFYFELNWYTQDPTRIIKPDLKVNSMNSIASKAKEIIDSYLQGNFESVLVKRPDGSIQKVVSDEAVFYVNSVNHILNIIKNNGLTPDQVNILCSDTETNNKRIRSKLGKKFSRGTIPLIGEKPKMFTFCTRTVYLGADFYSTCARSFIFSDSNSDCLAVDISEDLPQIMGRQRLTINPWKNSANFYYKTTADYKKMSKEDFENIIKKKSEKTNNLLGIYNDTVDFGRRGDLAEVYQNQAKILNYKNDYVAVNYAEDWDPINNCVRKIMKPVENNLVKINEVRAFDIQQIDYKDRFAVFSAIQNKSFNLPKETSEALDFMRDYDSNNTFMDRIRMLCNNNLSNDALGIVIAQIPDSDVVKSYFLLLGPERIKQLGYSITSIKKELGIVTFTPDLLINSVYSDFKVGDKLLLSDIKDRLTNIYNNINYKATPKAKDLENYFEVKMVYLTVTDIKTGKRKQQKGYELLKSYEQEYRDKLMK